MDLPKTIRTKGASLLEKTGVLVQLEAACLTLAATDPEMIRSMMISVSRDDADESMNEAVRRFAEERCIAADVDQHAGAMVIRLTRRTEGHD
jgi:hypothetical protein